MALPKIENGESLPEPDHLSQVLGCFQEGDAELIEELLDRFGADRAQDDWEVFQAGFLERMLRAARLMEAAR